MKIISRALMDYGLSRKSDSERLKQIFDNAGAEFPLESNWCGIAMHEWASLFGDTPKDPWVARNWLKFGKEVIEPKIGDICVFWRGSPHSWMGHVTIYCDTFWDNYLCLGGNQDGEVKFKPYHKSRILGFRRLP